MLLIFDLRGRGGYDDAMLMIFLGRAFILKRPGPVSVKSTLFLLALALQYSGRNSSAAHDLMFFKLIFPGALFYGEMLFHRHPWCAG
jgi:hypothetical protein